MSFLLTNQRISSRNTPPWIQDNLLAGLIVAGYDEKKGGQADSASHGWSLCFLEGRDELHVR